MLIIIAVILLCSAMSDSAAARDWEISERNAERRHKELMELKKSEPKVKREAKRTRVFRDAHGRFISEEIYLRDYATDGCRG